MSYLMKYKCEKNVELVESNVEQRKVVEKQNVPII